MPRSAPLAFTLPNWASWILVAVLASHVLDSPARWVLSLVHLEALIYLRDAFAASIVVAAIGKWINGGRPSPGLVILAALVPHVLWGMLIQPSLAQPIIGLKMYLSLILGVSFASDFGRRPAFYSRAFVVLFVLTALGVTINKFTPMPWAGMLIATAAGDTTVSREWSMAGIQRVSGFARASYDAALMLAMCGAVVLASPSTSKFVKFLVYLLAGLLIVVTTTKGILLAWLAMGLVLPFTSSKSWRNRLGIGLMTLPALIAAIPLITFAYDLKATSDSTIGWLLSSFAERINDMWPSALNLTLDHGGMILGRGIGGIGFSQRLLEFSLYNPADNMMVYLITSFGLLAFVYMYWLLRQFRAASNNLSQTVWASSFLWLTCWLVYGLTNNNIESPFCQTVAGLALGLGIQHWLHKSPSANEP